MRAPQAMPLRPEPATVRYVLASLLFAALLISRPLLESSMLAHMLLQLPLLMLDGYLFAQACLRSDGPAARAVNKMARQLRPYDENGVTGLFAALFVSAYWMIPRALEESLNQGGVESLKFISLLLLGAVLPGSLSRANRIIQVFFLGNFCWMTAIAGLLYQDAPQRLCNAYLLDDQAYTGIGLVLASLLIPLCWGIAQLPARTPKPPAPLTAQL